MRSHSKALFAVVALFAFLLPASASAVILETRPHVSSFDGSDSDAGSFVRPASVAVDEDDAIVYGLDEKSGLVGESGSTSLSKFDAAGAAQEYAGLGSSSLSGADIPPPDGPRQTLWNEVAVDTTNGVTGGNLYLLQPVPTNNPPFPKALYAFAPSGTYLAVREDLVGGNFAMKAVAVDADGDVWVAEGNFAEGLIRELDASLDPTGNVIDVSAQGPPGSIAFDSANNLYVSMGSEPAGSNSYGSLEKYDSTGAHLGQIEPGGVSDVAVNPVTDHVFALHRDWVSEYDPTGTFVTEFGHESLFTPTEATDLAAGIGDRVYVSAPGQVINVFGPSASIAVADATATAASGITPVKATLEGTVDPLGVPSGVRFQYRIEGEGEWQRTPIQDVGSTPGTQNVSVLVSDLEDGANYEFRLLATNTAAGVQAPSPHVTFSTPAAELPVVGIDPILDPSATTADLFGQVDPEGVPTTYRFQYATQADFSDVISLSTESAGEGTAPVPVSEALGGLEPSTHYYVRIEATNAAGTVTSAVEEFDTDAVPPVVEALYPGPTTDSSAWLGAYVNPKNSPTTFYVEYSTDPGFASSISAPASKDASAGSGGALALANQLVTGLQPQTTYHYRVVVTNEVETVTGESRSFTTTAVLPPTQGLPDGRVWEKVSPSDKSGADINAGNYADIVIAAERAQAAVGGDGVTFGSAGKFGGAEGGPLQSQYLARRGPGGWSTEAINPPMDPVANLSKNLNYFQWFSNDLSKATATTHAALNPGDPKDVYNLYLRDNDAHSYATLSDSDASTKKWALSELRAVSADGEHFLYRTSEGGPSTDFSNSVLMERLIDGTVRPVSVLPDGSVVEGEPGSGFPNGIGGRQSGFNSISENGSRIFFQTPSSGTEPGHLYVREDGETTRPVSASERTGDDPDAPVDGDFLGASADGSVAFFRAAEPLTDDTPTGGVGGCPEGGKNKARPARICHLYRWDAHAPAEERLTNLSLGDPEGDPEGALVLGMLGMSDDGKSVYFAAYGDIDGNGSRTVPNLYLWREGEGVRFVARLQDGDSTGEQSDAGLWGRNMLDFGGQSSSSSNNENYKPARVTPDGRYLTFSTHVPQTSYETDEKQVIYLYDSHTGRITCVSCGSVASKSKGDSWFVSCAWENNSETRCSPNTMEIYAPRNFRSDGKRLIFDSKDALVPEDTNGVTDVYEWQEGRLHLLSSGTSAFPSRFVDASADGDDVFFTTAQRLTASDNDQLRDLYDARVGGVPEPNVTHPCVADECQGTPKAAPSFQTPSSSGFEGPGNATVTKPRCGKAKVRRNGRCVRRKARKQAKQKARNGRANQNRRAGR